MIAILALRVVTRGRFLYLTTNEMETLLGFSLLQGLTFQWCRESSMRWPR